MTSDGAFGTHGAIIECLARSNQYVPLLAQGFYEMKHEKLYKTLGMESFKQYIADPELPISYARANRLANTFRDLVSSGLCQEEIFNEVEETKLNLLRQVRDEYDFEEWIIKAKTLSFSDLRREVADRLGKEYKVPASAQEKEAVVAKQLVKFFDNCEEVVIFRAAHEIVKLLDVL